MWLLLSFIRKATLSFSRIIVVTVMTAILPAVGIPIIRIPINTAICTVMTAHLSAGKFYFILLTFIIHLFPPPFLLNCLNFILYNNNPVVLPFSFLVKFQLPFCILLLFRAPYHQSCQVLTDRCYASNPLTLLFGLLDYF